MEKRIKDNGGKISPAFGTWGVHRHGMPVANCRARVQIYLNRGCCGAGWRARVPTRNRTVPKPVPVQQVAYSLYHGTSIEDKG